MCSQFTDDAELRLEKVVCLALQPYLALSDDATYMLEDVERLVRETGIAVEFDEDDDLEEEDWIFELLMARGFNGWFIEVAHAKSGWGLYNSRWFYADTVDEALAKALAYTEWPQEKVSA
jgi:hypothetical protein